MNSSQIKSLTNKSILLSGGTGFIGKNFLYYLDMNKIELSRLTIITRNKKNFEQDNPKLASLKYLDFIESDICNLEYNGSYYDYVIHGATSVVEKVNSLNLADDILLGTKKILNFAIKAQAKSVLNLSSGAIYGAINTTIPVTENFPSLLQIEQINSTYGMAKLMAEHMSYLYANKYNLKITSLRCFAFGGNYLDKKHFALGDLINKVLNNEDVIVQAGGQVYRSYLSAYDLAEWIIHLLIEGETRSNNYEVYNVGSDIAISIPDLAHRINKVLNGNSSVSCPNLNNHIINYYIPNIEKVKSLGINIKYSLDEVIIQTANYYK